MNRFRVVRAVLCAMFLSVSASISGAQARIGIVVQPLEGVFGMIERPDAAGENKPVPVEIAVKSADGKARRVSLGVTARDVFDRPSDWNQRLDLDLPADGTAVKRAVQFQSQRGFYQVIATTAEDGETFEASTAIGIVPPPRAGLRPDSFFASNTSHLRRGKDLDLLKIIGMKVQRAHFEPNPSGQIPQQPTGSPVPLDFRSQDQAFVQSQAAGIWVLPIVGYSFGGKLRSDLAKSVDMHGPPRDAAEWVSTWEQILRRYPQIETWEFWNEPWIYGWTWAADGAEYRKLQAMWCQMALKVNPALRIVAGNSSMFVEDHIEPHPESWKGLLAGITHHPYAGVHGPSMRNSGQGRSIDHGAVVNRRMGLSRYYITEGGSWAGDRVDVYKLVQYTVRSALAGAFQGNAQWGIGYGPSNTRANTSFAVLANMIEDRPAVADIWPAHELIWGAIFAHPRHVTDAVRQLPRAGELAARWGVSIPPERVNDATKVAILWSDTGPTGGPVDREGTINLADAAGLKAYDVVGREIPAQDGKLTLPFNEYPVYVATDALSVVELRERIANARIDHVTPLNLYALSLMKPATQEQELRVRVQNQLNRPVSGTLTMRRAIDGTATSARFQIPPAGLIEVPVSWPAGTIGTLGTRSQYEVALSIESDAGAVKREQMVAAARFVKRTIAVDGTLADWEGVAPVMIDSRDQKASVDLIEYVLNPGRRRPEATDAKRIAARIYTAYDDQNVYLAAAVEEPALRNSAGTPATRGRAQSKVTLPYRTGMPDGLDHIRLTGDVFSFAFGFQDRVPGWGRQMDDPWAWKGHFYDTDYHYVAHISTEGDQLLRQWSPDTGRRTAYQASAMPGYGPVAGAQIRIRRDEPAGLTVYKMSIPRAELALFDPKVQDRLRFGFMLPNDERVGPGGALQWSAAAGVFDHWQSTGSFGPSWMAVLPCQTFFGIEKP